MVPRVLLAEVEGTVRAGHHCSVWCRPMGHRSIDLVDVSVGDPSDPAAAHAAASKTASTAQVMLGDGLGAVVSQLGSKPRRAIGTGRGGGRRMSVGADGVGAETTGLVHERRRGISTSVFKARAPSARQESMSAFPTKRSDVNSVSRRLRSARDLNREDRKRPDSGTRSCASLYTLF